jgi:glycosyltransferase involved in cell wall biosynthesis
MPPVSKIKVAFYCFFPGGGIGQYTHELLKSLAQIKSVSVSLFCPPNFAWIKEAEYETHPILFQISSDQPLIRKMKFLMGQWINPRRFIQHACQTNTNVLHYSNFNHLTYPLWKGLIDRNQVIQACSAHDVKRGVSILNRSWENRQLCQFYRDCNLIFVHSESQKQELETFAKPESSEIIIVPHGPYAFAGNNCPNNARPSGKKNLTSKGLFFGNIRDEKNLDGLIRAIALSRENIQLTVAGKSGISGHKPIRYYRDLATELEISDRIDWIDGHVPENQVGTLFQSTDWVALPYKDQFTSQSGVFNISTHFSKPMLITPAPTFRELLEKYPLGELANNDSPQEIQNALNRLINGVLKTKYDGFKSYQNYHTWENNADLTAKSYKSALCQ